MNLSSVKALGVILLLVYVQGLYASEQFRFPDSSLVSDSTLGEVEFDVVLSAPKRISNAIDIEKQERVRGVASSRLYELKSGVQLKEVFNHYLEVTGAQGDVLFQCEKRACGSSNYWANKIFEEHKLYGRDSSQFYLASVSRNEGVETWTLAYIVQNGLRKKYVYELSISRKSISSDVSGVWINGTSFGPSGLSDRQLEILKTYITSNKVGQLYLVVYSDQAIKPTSAFWDELSLKSEIQIEQIKHALAGLSLTIDPKVQGPLHNDDGNDNSSVWYRLYAY